MLYDITRTTSIFFNFALHYVLAIIILLSINFFLAIEFVGIFPTFCEILNYTAIRKILLADFGFGFGFLRARPLRFILEAENIL